MAAKRFTKTGIDWAAFAERVANQEKGKFLQFKAKTDGYMKNLMSYPEKPPAIDWTMFRSRINPALVDDFEKKYNSLKITFPADKLTASIDEQAKLDKRETEEFIELSKLRIELHEKEHEWWKKMMPFDEMSMDEYKDYFPDQAPDYLGKPNFWPYDEPPTPVFPYRENKPH